MGLFGNYDAVPPPFLSRLPTTGLAIQSELPTPKPLVWQVSPFAREEGSNVMPYT